MTQKILKESLANALTPLARILIRYGVTYGDFCDVAKRAFVTEAARQDFQLEGRKQSKARIAMLTGVQRKEVSRVLSEDPVDGGTEELQYNRGARVISGWRRDADFSDEHDGPRELPFEGAGGFAELVRRYSGDLPARAVLDELVRIGCVERDDSDRVRLVGDEVLVPRGDQVAQFDLMGKATRDLLMTIDHNVECDRDDERLQLTVAYDNLSEKSVRRFQHISHEDSLALLKKFDSWLAQHDRDVHPDSEGADGSADAGRYRAGIGIYYFEEEINEDA
jgi:hypothetical protein